MCIDLDSSVNVALLFEIQPMTDTSIIVGSNGNLVGYTSTMEDYFDSMDSFCKKPLQDFSPSLSRTVLSQLSEYLNLSKVESFLDL